MKIPLTQGKFALIDRRDYWLVRQFTWCAHREHNLWYAVTGVPQIKMHRLLAGFPPFQLDHKNGNGLDNRRRNLRPATRTQNLANQRLSRANTSGFKGVSWHKQATAWRACIRYNKRHIHLGYFATKQAAARAYKSAAKKYFGEFATT